MAAKKHVGTPAAAGRKPKTPKSAARATVTSGAAARSTSTGRRNAKTRPASGNSGAERTDDTLATSRPAARGRPARGQTARGPAARGRAAGEPEDSELAEAGLVEGEPAEAELVEGEPGDGNAEGELASEDLLDEDLSEGDLTDEEEDEPSTEGDDDGESTFTDEDDASDRTVALQEEVRSDVEDPYQPREIGLSRADRGLARLDPMQAYMREVQQHPLLSPEEEKALAVRYAETGDLDAAARLVTSNLRLVVKLAYEYRRAYRNMMDLIQEGNMGLMQAVKKFDPYRGVKLSSYAAWWIRAYMLRYILANWRMVKLGTTQAQRKLFFNLNKEKARLSAMGIEPTSAEIAKRLDVTESEVDEMDKRMSRGDASLDLPVSESDGRQIARVEMLPAAETTPDLATEGAELGVLLKQHLEEFRELLSGKDLQIFDERLVADEPRTLQDLGDEFGVSRERVRQLEARITGRLRRFLSERLGDAVEIGG